MLIDTWKARSRAAAPGSAISPVPAKEPEPCMKTEAICSPSCARLKPGDQPSRAHCPFYDCLVYIYVILFSIALCLYVLIWLI